ncbi:unnamed protein product, partial [Symbiodinium natans]
MGSWQILALCVVLVRAKDCEQGQGACPKTGGLDLVQVRSAVAAQELIDAEGPPHEEECEISSIAKDYYWKPPEHEFICHRRGKPDLDLDVGTVQHFHPVTGDNMTIRGYAYGRAKFKVEEFTPRGRAKPMRASFLQSVAASGVETRTAAVLMIRFLDASGNLIPSSMDTAEERKSFAIGVNNSLYGIFDHASRKTNAGTWHDCSYGKLQLQFDTDQAENDLASDVPGEGADIFYADVPIVCDTATDSNCPSNYDSTSSCSSSEYYGWPRYAFKSRPELVKSNWQHWVVIFPRDIVNCNFVGLGNVGCSSSYCYSWIPHDYSTKIQDYTHELGHNLGLAHAGIVGGSEYGDYSCAMGYCCSVRCYNAPHAYELGWITPSLELNDANFPSILTGVPLRSMSLHSDGAISITVDWVSPAVVYWVQLKTAHHYDTYMKSAWRNNVQIKQWNKGGYEISWHLKTLVEGENWTSDDGEVTVSVESIDTITTMTALLTLSRATAATTTTTAPPTTTTTAPPTTTTTAAPTTTTTAPPTTTTTAPPTTTTSTPPTTTTTAPPTTTTTAPPTTTTTTSTTTTTTTTVSTSTTTVDLCAGVTCQASDACHSAGVCNPATGLCSNPPKPDGTSCEASGPCDIATCQSGQCTVTSQEPDCCGNSLCEAGEDCNSCSSDCESKTGGGPLCGNGICETADGEDCRNCPADCAGRTNGKKSRRYCCGRDVSCSDSRCSASP